MSSDGLIGLTAVQIAAQIAARIDFFAEIAPKPVQVSFRSL